MLWGQAPGTIYGADPRTHGMLVAGDFVTFLMSPNPEGLIRVKVWPHDDRLVGNTDDKVWIDWGGLVEFGLERIMFTCVPAPEPATEEESSPAPGPEPEPKPGIGTTVPDAADPVPDVAGDVTVANSYTAFFLEPGRYVATTTGADSSLQGQDGQDWCSLQIVDVEGGYVGEEIRGLEAFGTHQQGFSISSRDGSGPFYIDDLFCGGPFTVVIRAAR